MIWDLSHEDLQLFDWVFNTALNTSQSGKWGCNQITYLELASMHGYDDSYIHGKSSSCYKMYTQTCNIIRSLVDDTIVDHSDVGAAPTTFILD